MDKKQYGEAMNESPLSVSSTIFIGTYTSDSSKGIYEARFLPETGSFESGDPTLVSDAVNPSFLAWKEDQDILYAVNEVEKGGISAFKLDDDSKTFKLMNHVPSEGSAPCHVSISHSGKIVASANYSTGNVITYSINEDGSLSDNVTEFMNEGELGPTSRQDKPHAHCGMFAKDDRFLYVVDLGLDAIIAYPLGEEGITGEPHTAMKLDPGDGPRHMIFHPSKDMAFVITELSNSIVSMSVDPEKGIFQKIDKKSTLPEGYSETSYCADIHITSDGKYLYGSNRGHNSIAAFKVSDEGMLTFLETESVQGDWPRNFAISPDEKYLLVANQKSNNVTVFSIDPKTGLLTFTGNQLKAYNPVCVIFK
ncbi:MAG: lactonase family protein [Bacteroidota bacterium]